MLMEQNKKESLIWSNSSVGQLRMRMEITGDGKRGKGSHVHLWKNAIVHVKRMDDLAIPWIRSSEKLLTESPQGTDYALQLYLHWSREKLVLNVDLEQIETNFSFIVSLCNLYRTFRIWDTSSITFLITVHRKKAPVMVRCIVNSRYVGCIRTIMKVWGKTIYIESVQ